jgi:hypothetical protein
MKKMLLLAVALLMIALPCFAWETWQVSGTLTGGVVTDNTTLTITLPSRVGSNSYLYVPTIDSAAIALSGSLNGTAFGTIASNYSATALIDFTYAATTGGKMLKLPDISAFRYIKITCGAGQSANRTFIIFGR